jgi:outer membrane lipase/esterase
LGNLASASAGSEPKNGSGALERQFLAAGYDYEAIGGIVGAEYRVNPRLLFGGVLGYSTSNVDLWVQNAHDHVDSYQLGGYGSFTGANVFADALIAYGRHDYALDREGVIDIVRGSTSADALAVAAKTGYLFDAGPVRVGPIAGLTYTRVVIGGYTETGDSLLTMRVNQQDLDALTGDAGLQLRFPFELGGNTYSPFINLTAERDFGSSWMVTTTLVTAPLLPVLTPVSGQSHTYGKVAAGVAANIAGTVRITVNAETTFARGGGDDLVGGFKMGF